MEPNTTFQAASIPFPRENQFREDGALIKVYFRKCLQVIDFGKVKKHQAFSHQCEKITSPINQDSGATFTFFNLPTQFDLNCGSGIGPFLTEGK